MLGWICTYTPEEIFAALGLDSFRLYGKDNTVALSYFPVNFCPLARACFGDGESRLGSSLSGVVLTASCHALVRLADGFKAVGRGNIFVHLLDLPRLCSGHNMAAVRSFSLSLRNLTDELSAFYGVKWDEGMFRSAVEGHRRVRHLLRQIYQLQCEHPESVRAAGLLEVVRAASQGKKDTFYPILLSVVKSLRGETDPAPGSQAGVLLKQIKRRGSLLGPRLLVVGSPLPAVYLDLFEELGANIAGDDLCQGYRYCLPEIGDDPDPFNALACGYLSRVPCPRMLSGVERMAYLRERAAECRVDGIIFHALKFCDNSLYEFPLIHSFMEKEGIPVLYLETEYRDAGLEQVRTRVQAFLEILG